jgi:hypothetical protein
MKTEGNNDMNAALVKVSAARAQAVDDLARRISKEVPNPSALSPEDLEKPDDT